MDNTRSAFSLCAPDNTVFGWTATYQHQIQVLLSMPPEAQLIFFIASPSHVSLRFRRGSLDMREANF